jgi:predicted enzyme related to lactoylglutathione lyase
MDGERRVRKDGPMQISSVTIGLTVSNLTAASAWYERVFELATPDLEPIDGVVEYDLGTSWLQLGEGQPADTSSTTIRFDVADVAAEFARLTELDLEIQLDELVHVPDVIDFFVFRDPDGNLLSFYSLA